MMQPYYLTEDNPRPLANLLQWIASRDPTKPWKVVVSEATESTSDKQRGYYFGVVLATLQKQIRETRGENYSTEELHEWMKDEFLSTQQVTIKGKTKTVTPSITRLKVKEMAEYLDLIIHMAAESGIVIPDPEYKTER